MGITDAIGAKFNAVKADYEREQRLKKAADIAYKQTYRQEHGKAEIKNAIARAKADAKSGSKGGGGLQFNPQGFMMAMDTAIMGSPQKAAPKPKAVKPQYTTIKVDGHKVQIPKKAPKKKKQQAGTGFELSPFVFEL